MKYSLIIKYQIIFPKKLKIFLVKFFVILKQELQLKICNRLLGLIINLFQNYCKFLLKKLINETNYLKLGLKRLQYLRLKQKFFDKNPDQD